MIPPGWKCRALPTAIVLRKPPFLDLVVLILIGFNYFSSVSASGRGVIGHVTKVSLNKEGTIEQPVCVGVTELAAC